MRFYPYLLLAVLLVTALVSAQTDEGNESEDEKSDRPTKVKPQKKNQQKSEAQGEDYPECHSQMIDGRPAYFCERIVNGETQTFGIKFNQKKSLICGEFQDQKANGPAYRLYLDDEYEKKIFCGSFVNEVLNGSISWDFFETRSMQLSNVMEGERMGTSWAYYMDTEELFRFWYTDGKCRSEIGYGQNGTEISRNPYKCGTGQ